MKKYITITHNICNIGGGQIYNRNKLLYLKKNGWEVFLISQNYNGIVLIDELKPHRCNAVAELKVNPFWLSDSKRISVIKKIEAIAGSWKLDDEVVIESHTIVGAIWGEILAENFRCKHIVYLLGERFTNVRKTIFPFLNFKHSRKELAGIHSSSLALLFEGYKQVDESDSYYLKACVGNVVEDVESSIADSMPDLDFTIGIISRLSKPYIPSCLEQLSKFAKKYPNKRMNLLLVGGASTDHKVKKIKEKLDNCSNLNLIMPGQIFPIPRKLLRKVDLFIGTAGSARITAFEGRLTVAIDARTHKPIGVLGVNTSETLYSKEDCKESLCEILEKVFICKKYQPLDMNADPMSNISDFWSEYKSHTNFISNSAHTKEYYQFCNKISSSDRLKALCFRLIPLEWMNQIIKYKNKIRYCVSKSNQ